MLLTTNNYLRQNNSKMFYTWITEHHPQRIMKTKIYNNANRLYGAGEELSNCAISL